MKKIKRYIICLIMCLMIGITSVNAKELEVISVKPNNENDLSSVEIKENDDKSFDVLFKDIDVEVKYVVEIKNESEKEIQIDEISITGSRNEAFLYSYEGIDKNTVINGGETKTFNLNIKYTNTEDIEKIYDEDVTLKISYSNVEEVVNPKTGIKTLGYVGIVSIILVIGYLIIRKKLTMFKQFGAFVLIASVVSVIGVSLANKSGEIEINGIVRHRGYYDVTIDPNGGYYKDSNEIQKFQVLAGEKYKLEEAKREDYTFVSWEVNPSNVEIKDNEVEVTDNLLIKALWDEVYYTLIIDPNTGVYQGISEEIKTSERPNSTVNLSVPEKTGYTFSHWTIEEEIYNKNSVEMTRDIKLVANYKKNTYKVEIDPNGGLFNNSSEKYIGTHEHGDKIRIDDIKRENYDFIGYSDGEKLITEEEIEITSDVKLKAMWETIIKHTVRVNPNGGIYDNTSDISSYEVREGSKFEIQNVEYEGYVLDHWEKEDGTILNSNEFIVEEDVTIIAKWEEIVCRIEDTYYSSIMKAHEKAVAKDTIVLLKDTEEIVENRKDVTLDLGGHKVTGSLTNTNTGKITIINGTIENPNGTAIINNGTLTMGINDYKEDGSANIISDYVKIIGTTIGIEQNNVFNFYDGFIEGDIGLDGGYNDSPSYRNIFDDTVIKYFPFVDHNVEKNCQHIELEASDRAVSKTITNGEIYYYNLQDNINTSLITGYKIYAVRDFDASYPLNVPNGGNITFDIDGKNVLIGDDITNEGTFTIMDGQNKTGSLKTSKTITNNGELSLKDIDISKTQNGNLIENNGDLTLTKTKLISLTGASVKTNGTSTLNMDEESALHSNDYALYVSQGSTIELTVGTIYGINNFGTLTINGLNVFSNGDNNAILSNQNANLTIESGTITSTKTAVSSSGNLTITGGKIESTNYIGIYQSRGNLTISNVEVTAENSALELSNVSSDSKIAGGTFNGKYGIYMYSSSPTITGGTFKGGPEGAHMHNNSSPTITGGTFTGNQYGAYSISNSSPKIIGGTIIGNTYGIYTNSGTLTLGESGGKLDNTTPVIMGGTYGIYNTNNNTKISYYDGILKGTEFGYYGTIEVLEDGTRIKTDSENIDNQEYVTNYLVAKENFLRVNGVEYNSFQNAIDAIDLIGTIYLIATTSYDSDAIIPTGKDVTFDLNGNKLTMTQTLTNNGALTIKDSVGEGELINANNETIINNKGTILTIESGKISSSTTVIKTSGDLIITGGEIESTDGRGIYSSERGSTVTISNVEITAKNNALYITSSLVNITGGTYISTTNSGVELNSCSSDSKITNGTFTGGTNGIVLASTSLTISGGEFSGKNRGVHLNSSSPTITGGTFIGEQCGAYMYNNSSPTITGGTFTGDIYGIYYANSSLTLGTNDEEIKNIPEIIGGTYGLYNTSNNTKISYYDGILKGSTAGFNGAIENIATNSNIVYDQEIKGEVTYNINYLEKQKDFIKNNRTDKKYYIINDAIEEASDNDTLSFIRDANVYDEVNIPSDKNINMDLSGHNILINRSIINNGTLNLINSSENEVYIKSSTRRETISNAGNLTITDIKLINEFDVYALVNTGNMILDTSTIESYNGIKNSNADARLTINNSNITSTNYCINNVGILDVNSSVFEAGTSTIYDTGNHENTIKNSTVHASSNYALYALYLTSNFEVINSDFVGTIRIQNASGVLNVTGGSITGEIDNYGSATINDVTAENNSYVIKNYRTFEIINSIISANVYITPYSPSCSAITNDQKGTLIVDKDTIIKIKAENVSGELIGINNQDGTVEHNGTINVTDANQGYGIYNKTDNNSIDITDGTINVTGVVTGYGVYLKQGTANITAGNINVTTDETRYNKSNGYGIYLEQGTVNITNGNITATGQNAYGIYINQGIVTLGIPEDVNSSNYGKDTADVSITNPLISGIGTIEGYGIKNAQGRLNYYDGKLIGSTSAKPEIATNVEYLYEATNHTDEDGYEYTILEWMRRSTFSAEAELDIS